MTILGDRFIYGPDDDYDPNINEYAPFIYNILRHHLKHHCIITYINSYEHTDHTYYDTYYCYYGPYYYDNDICEYKITTRARIEIQHEIGLDYYTPCEQLHLVLT